MRLATFSAIPVVLLFGACSGTTPVQPIAAAGFASSEVGPTPDYDYTVRNATRIVGSDGVLRLDTAPEIRVAGTVGTGPITVEFGGETYSLERSPTNRDFATFDEDGQYVSFFSTLTNSNHAVGVSLFSFGNDTLDSGQFVMGYDTNPAVVGQIEGTAAYPGILNVTLRNGYDDAFGGGNFTLTANFDDNTVGGSGELRDSELSQADFAFDPVTITFEAAQIRQNGFSGNITADPATVDGELVSATYTGRFFGPEAESLGGQFNGEIAVDGLEQNTLVDGIFLGTK